MDARMLATWCVYLLRCADDSLYCGVTNDLERRVRAHQAGRVKYTRGRRPVAVAWTQPTSDRGEALRRELQIKALDRPAKLALVAAGAP